MKLTVEKFSGCVKDSSAVRKMHFIEASSSATVPSTLPRKSSYIDSNHKDVLESSNNRCLSFCHLLFCVDCLLRRSSPVIERGHSDTQKPAWMNVDRINRNFWQQSDASTPYGADMILGIISDPREIYFPEPWRTLLALVLLLRPLDKMLLDAL